MQQAEEALRRLSAPCNLITEDSIASNPIAVLEPSAELQRAMAWKPAVETRAKEAIADLESMFESNPLLPSIKDEANALRAKIKLGKDITDFEQAIASLFKEGSGVYANEEVAAKQSDLTKRDSFAAVLKSIVDLRAGLADYHSAKSKLLAQEFEDVPKRAKACWTSTERCVFV